MEIQRIEYVRKNGKRKGIKRGVLYCGLHPNDNQSVVVGFSLCNKLDKFDYIGGERKPGFGLNLARIRAEKWSNHINFFVQNSWGEDIIYDTEDPLNFIINPNPSEIVEIPPSIEDALKVFIDRCRKYYKDKDFPVWVKNFENGDSDIGDFEVEDMRDCVV